MSALMVVAVMTGVWRLCRRFLKLSASAPAFIFLNIFFIWFVYFLVVRQAISSLLDIAFNSGLTLLVIGLYSILSSDPGFIKFEAACLEKHVSSPSGNGEAHPEDGPSARGSCNCGIRQGSKVSSITYASRKTVSIVRTRSIPLRQSSPLCKAILIVCLKVNWFGNENLSLPLQLGWRYTGRDVRSFKMLYIPNQDNQYEGLQIHMTKEMYRI